MVKNKGNIGITHLIGWGLAISTFLGGIFWAKVSATDNNLETFKAKIADDKVEYTRQTATIATKLDNLIVIVDKLDKRIK